jgi:hypothetical protein
MKLKIEEVLSSAHTKNAFQQVVDFFLICLFYSSCKPQKPLMPKEMKSRLISRFGGEMQLKI